MAEAQILSVKNNIAEKILTHNFSYLHACDEIFGWFKEYKEDNTQKASIYKSITATPKEDIKTLFPKFTKDRNSVKKYKVPKEIITKCTFSNITSIEIIKRKNLIILLIQKF